MFFFYDTTSFELWNFYLLVIGIYKKSFSFILIW